MAYVAVLSTDDFLDGVLVLDESLRLCQSQYRLHTLVGSKVSGDVRKRLKRAGVSQIAMPSLDIPSYIITANEESDHHRHWANVFDKLRVFSLCQFEKIVYIDSDVLVVRNIDDLFNRPHLSATRAGKVPGRRDATAFSTGLMVIEPQPDITDELVKLLPSAFENERRWRSAAGRPMSIGDQSVINMNWRGWMQRDELHLDAKYNVMATHLDYYVSELGYRWRGPDAIRVLHFDGQVKPWMIRRSRFYRHMTNLIIRRRPWELAAVLAYKTVLQKTRLRLAYSPLTKTES